MNKALITFSNGERLELYPDQLIILISKFVKGNEIFTSQQEVYTIWYHASAGLIPSITEFLCKCDFFQLSDETNKIYKSSAVVSIENL